MKAIEEKQGFLKLPDGQELFFQMYRPSKPKGSLIIIHGLGEHSGRHQKFSKHMIKHGWAVYLFDQRGHGKTPGIRGHAENFQVLVKDLSAVVKEVKALGNGRKCFLVGHSFGGQVIINFLAQHPHMVQGAIIFAPNIKLRLQIPWFKKMGGELLSLILPSLGVSNLLRAKDLSRDPKVVENFNQDPLVIRKVSLRLASGMFKNQDEVLSLAPKIKTPCLILHGEEDKITCPEGSQEFFEKMKVRDREIKIYPHSYHELLNDIGKEKVYQDLEAWLEKRVKN